MKQRISRGRSMPRRVRVILELETSAPTRLLNNRWAWRLQLMTPTPGVEFNPTVVVVGVESEAVDAKADK